MEREKLLDCPFCGCKIVIDGGCDCGSCPDGIFHENNDCVLGSRVISAKYGKTLDDLIEEWNRRIIPDDYPAYVPNL